jgi:hypothetical protein
MARLYRPMSHRPSRRLFHLLLATLGQRRKDPPHPLRNARPQGQVLAEASEGNAGYDIQVCYMPHEQRRLTYDEMKAAEAAFQGRAFNESWSQAARLVYDGIVAATRTRKPVQGVVGLSRANSVPAEPRPGGDGDRTMAVASSRVHPS